MSAFATRYGPWAVVAGASEGIGAAFAAELARRGLGLILVARRPEPLRALAATLPGDTVVVSADLATTEGVAAVLDAACGRSVGLVVCNAAYSPIGPFRTLDPGASRRALDLNCAAPLLLAHHFLPGMVARGQGGFVIMSSLAGQQGTPGVAVYAATKAFGAILAESLWAELRGCGVDVVACVAGAVATPGLSRALTERVPGTVTPQAVVAATLSALGRRPRTVPGTLMKVSSAVLTRLLPRRAAIGLMTRSGRELMAGPGPGTGADADPGG